MFRFYVCIYALVCFTMAAAMTPEHQQLLRDYQELQERHRQLFEKHQELRASNTKNLKELDRMIEETIRPYLAASEEREVRDQRTIQQLESDLAEEKQDAKKNYKGLHDEIDILRKQLEHLRSLQGWLLHKEGAKVWIGLACITYAYKKGSYDWIARIEKKVKKVVSRYFIWFRGS